MGGVGGGGGRVDCFHGINVHPFFSLIQENANLL